MPNKFKNKNKNGNLPLIVVNDQLVSFLLPVNVSRPKFAAVGPPTNLRNAQLASFFKFGFIFAASWIRT